MKAIEIRNKYLNFFKAHGHKVIPSAPLIPENEKSVRRNGTKGRDCAGNVK